jgi:hypothetical protein
MIATRIDADMGGWCPVSRLYAVDGGHIAVTVADFLTANATQVFYADEAGGAISLEPLITFNPGTSHDEALTNLGYTVIDTVGAEPAPELPPEIPVVEESVFDLLPPEISAVITAAKEEEAQ